MPPFAPIFLASASFNRWEAENITIKHTSGFCMFLCMLAQLKNHFEAPSGSQQARGMMGTSPLLLQILSFYEFVIDNETLHLA